jgi:uncharacterized protein YecT (DUF1311 family)
MKLRRHPHLWTIALLASVFGSLPARADDAAIITNCITTELNRYACIGRMSKDCMTKPGGETTVGMKMCSAREAEAWDALLNTEYTKVLGNLDDAAKKKLRAAQRAWITMRDNDCQIPFDVYAGGTIAGVIAGNCLMERTAARTLQLRDLRESSDAR